MASPTPENGWIKAHRKMVDWEWFATKNMFHLFMYLLLKANHKDKKWQGIMVKRGQVITGRKALSAATGISERSIRTCLKRLESTGETTSRTTNRFSIITICNYEKYQVTENQNDQPKANKRPASDQQATTNKNDKNIKNKRTKTTIPDIFPITDKMRSWFESQNFKNISIEPATEQFKDYWKSEGKLKADWIATWRNGMKLAEKWGSNGEDDKSWQI